MITTILILISSFIAEVIYMRVALFLFLSLVVVYDRIFRNLDEFLKDMEELRNY